MVFLTCQFQNGYDMRLQYGSSDDDMMDFFDSDTDEIVWVILAESGIQGLS